MFDTETFAEIISLAMEAGIEPAALLAVAEVESGGRALFDIDGKKSQPFASRGIISTADLSVVSAIRHAKQDYQHRKQDACAIPRPSASAGFCSNGPCRSIKGSA